jgi:DNA repair photolyase
MAMFMVRLSNDAVDHHLTTEGAGKLHPGLIKKSQALARAPGLECNQMIVKEIFVKSILSKSKIQDYALNPYVGCSHACRYCYAAFMRRFTGHKEKWGEFVDIKVNAPELLVQEIKKKPRGRAWMSGVCDPYQPVEKKYKLTARCLEILLEHQWPVTIQTKSSLVLRDIEILAECKDIKVGFSITTADENIREIFEPGATPIKERIQALEILHSRGISTFVMIAPILPRVNGLLEKLPGKVDSILIDRLNYSYANRVYLDHKMEWAKEDLFFIHKAEELKTGFMRRNISVQVLF